MKGFSYKHYRLTGSILAAATFVMNVAAQPSLAEKEKEFIDGSGDRMFYTVVFVVIASLGAAFYLWRRSKKGSDQPQYNYANRYADYYKSESYNMEGVDAEKELEWLRKAKKSNAKANGNSSKITFGVKAGAAGRKPAVAAARPVSAADDSPDTKLFQEKMRRLQYAQLPINSFSNLTPSKTFEGLPISEDASLLNAIEQANEEFEEDESVRELSVRILAAFKTRSSVDALAQIALYDLSSGLRSKAVSILTDFDHESVFEAILLACADPTREVRAAAGRRLFRLNFDRADAWKRIIETQDEFRMRHAARAAVEAGIVGKAFERLVHEDLKVSYEAFVLVALMIKARETAELFEAIQTHKDERVKYAILHVLRSIKDVNALNGLNQLYVGHTFPTELNERILETIKSFDRVPA